MSFTSEFRQVRAPSHERMPTADIQPGTRRPFAKAFACAGATWVALTSLLVFFAARDASPGGMSSDQLHATVNVLLLLAIPSASLAVITGLIVQSTPRAWPLWGIALAFLSMFLALIFLVVGVASL